MNVFRGIAVVTETLRFVVSAAARAVPNTSVRTGPPDGTEPAAGPMVNVFLSSVRPNVDRHTTDLRTRDSDGRRAADATMAIELDYVISFVGGDDTVEPELLLGAVVAALHAQPVIAAATVIDALRESSVAGLSSSDLGGPVEIVPLALTNEERCTLWSVLRVPYRLSIEYRVHAVLVPTPLDVADVSAGGADRRPAAAAEVRRARRRWSPEGESNP